MRTKGIELCMLIISLILCSCSGFNKEKPDPTPLQETISGCKHSASLKNNDVNSTPPLSKEEEMRWQRDHSTIPSVEVFNECMRMNWPKE